MTGWAFFAVYAVGWLLTWRKTSWLLANDFATGYDMEGVDIAFGLVLGALVALFWPVLVPGYCLWRRELLTRGGMAFLSPPKHMAREKLLDEREHRIARLEREVGIR